MKETQQTNEPDRINPSWRLNGSQENKVNKLPVI